MPGTTVTDSTSKTSLTWRRSMAKGSPPNVKTHMRQGPFAGGTGRVSMDEMVRRAGDDSSGWEWVVGTSLMG